MDVLEAIRTRIDIREFADEPVADDDKRAILDAARLAASGRNAQHWRFVLVEDADRLDGLGERSPSGGWIADAAFAVAVVTDPDFDFHRIDAGKAVTHMQLAAWDRGVGSCMYTTESTDAVEFLGIPDEYHLTAVVGFGYPTGEIDGEKDREPLDAIAFDETFGTPTDLGE